MRCSKCHKKTHSQVTRCPHCRAEPFVLWREVEAEAADAERVAEARRSGDYKSMLALFACGTAVTLRTVATVG